MTPSNISLKILTSIVETLSSLFSGTLIMKISSGELILIYVLLLFSHIFFN